jgi:type II secretory pathway pseudopilin PulG
MTGTGVLGGEEIIMRKTKKYSSGQSLFELVFSIVVASIVLIAIVSLSSTSIRNAVFSRNNAVATKYAQEATEWLIQQRDENWNNLSGNLGTRNLGELNWGSGANIPGTPFQRTVTLVSIDSEQIRGTVRVTWSDGQGLHKVENFKVFTAWQ